MRNNPKNIQHLHGKWFTHRTPAAFPQPNPLFVAVGTTGHRPTMELESSTITNIENPTYPSPCTIDISVDDSLPFPMLELISIYGNRSAHWQASERSVGGSSSLGIGDLGCLLWSLLETARFK